jgi:hypothetical protein
VGEKIELCVSESVPYLFFFFDDDRSGFLRWRNRKTEREREKERERVCVSVCISE